MRQQRTTLDPALLMLLRCLTAIVFDTLKLLLGWGVTSFFDDYRPLFKLLDVPSENCRDDPMERSAEVDDVRTR